jgi:carboxyl-terminal processing protease
VGAAVALLLAGCTTTPAPRVSLADVPVERRARAEANVRVFDRVWSLVADWHYDPKLHGVDWPAAGAKYGAAAAAAAHEKAHYA